MCPVLPLHPRHPARGGVDRNRNSCTIQCAAQPGFPFIPASAYTTHHPLYSIAGEGDTLHYHIGPRRGPSMSERESVARRPSSWAIRLPRSGKKSSDLGRMAIPERGGTELAFLGVRLCSRVRAVSAAPTEAPTFLTPASEAPCPTTSTLMLILRDVMVSVCTKFSTSAACAAAAAGACFSRPPSPAAVVVAAAAVAVVAAGAA
jgi:hypothetical protein